MPRLTNDLRDKLLTAFRQEVCRKMDFVPFLHQAEWWAATDGLNVQDSAPRSDADPFVTVLIRETDAIEGEPILAIRVVNGVRCAVVRRRTLPRQFGRARVVADLGSFKIGKSKSSGMWAAGFAAIPGARVKLIGIEYDTCAPEFEYLVEALCSERGMNLTPDSLQNRPRDGRMWLDLPNGARFEARSWERKDGLKGKEDDCYIACEAYQLPGLECFTDYKQNLTAREGYFIAPTTPDRPWVKVFHEHGHGSTEFPEWQCVCGVPRDVNPYAFSVKAKEQDRLTMTKEKFAIAYEGQLGEFVGSVFNYQRGQRMFSTVTHPDCWRDPTQDPTLGNFQVPAHWDVLGAADTGTFTAGLLVAVAPDGDLLCWYEQPNYRYIAGRHEFDDDLLPSKWKAHMRRQMDRFDVRGLWADKNTQFKKAMIEEPNQIVLFGASAGLEERTETLREYFQQRKVWLAPWLTVLPFELEQAQWPAEATLAGKFARLKKQDHQLDCLEHLAAKRPLTVGQPDTRPGLWIEQFTGLSLSRRRTTDPHMGIM